MGQIIDEDSLITHLQAEEILNQYAGANVDAIARAVGVGNNDTIAALKRSRKYDSDAVDALTPDTAPPTLISIACAIATDDLTSGHSGRAESIGAALERAKSKLSLIATGNYLVEGLTLAPSSSPPTAKVSERVFTPENLLKLGRTGI
ncbi:MAG TPA: hypothetical protein VNL91_04150 [Thermoanaerobaculia bacterium]|nr:hypothetical protein [Thermoanaerobaculia bacterium]